MAPLPSAYPAMKPITAPTSPSNSPHSLSRRASVGRVDIDGRAVVTASTSAPSCVYASRTRSRRIHPRRGEVRAGVNMAVRREVLHDRGIQSCLLLDPCREIRGADHHRGVVGHVAVPETAQLRALD